MKIIVSGAGGFIGRRLVARLSEQFEVVALVRSRGQQALAGNPSWVESDLTKGLDHASLPERADVIAHLAQANVSFPEAANELFAVNTLSTQRLLEYARIAGARRFVLASSGDVYGGIRGRAREADPAAPNSFYAVTKYASELLLGSYASYLEPCVLRLFHPYGPGQSGRLIPNLAGRIQARASVLLNADGRPNVTPLYIEDVVTAFERAMSSSFKGAINVAGDRSVSIRDLAREIGRILDVEPVFDQTGRESGDLAGDNSLMKRLLGDWQMTDLAEGLRLTLAEEEEGECDQRA
jgi:nucleoside-diphosphate-sugar epimerase